MYAVTCMLKHKPHSFYIWYTSCIERKFLLTEELFYSRYQTCPLLHVNLINKSQHLVYLVHDMYCMAFLFNEVLCYSGF